MRFGELEATRLIGRGGMSEVWEATNPSLKSRYAVKVFTYGEDDAGIRARFEQEGRMLAKLSHPRIVRVIDSGTAEDGRPYFAMDLILNPAGRPQTLADVPDGSVDEETVARWYDDIREGLAYIHARGIVHRDLKLENIMVGADGHVVIADFGISRVSGGTQVVSNPVSTLVGLRDGNRPLMGSIGYMAPELEMGCAATPRSDWYAVGVIVYKMLTGTWCDSRTDVAAALGSFDPAWSRILPKLLHSNPAGRECPSFAETRRKIHESEAAAAQERYLEEKRRGHVARHAAGWVSIACVLLVAAICLGFIEHRSDVRLLRQRIQQARLLMKIPSCDELFATPAGAGDEGRRDGDGRVTMPSRNAFEASRIDAIVLTYPCLMSLANGEMSFEKAIAEIGRMADGLGEGAERSPLDGLEFGGKSYEQLGDDASLRLLLLQAKEKLREHSEAK